MNIPTLQENDYLRELRLFLEEICCNLLRFRHAAEGNIDPQHVRINQEYSLGTDAFADIRVEVAGARPYFIEVKYGYPPARTVASLTRKYGAAAQVGEASKIIVVGDAHLAANWADIEPQIRSGILRNLSLELWDEKVLLSMMRESFGTEVDSISESNALEMRGAIDRAKGRYAFEEMWTDDQLQNSLLWHYGFWRLRELRHCHELGPRAIMPPGLYRGVVTVMADLSGFSGYVKDTREDAIIRYCLTTFYSKARYEVLNTGGMMYQFVGDEVIGLYGIPDHPDDYFERAFDCAKALVDIGNSVSHEWQRQIDSVQKVRGVHIGICMGAIQVVALRPFSRAHLSGIGEVINLASRLLADAAPSEVVASNTYYQALAPKYQALFRPAAPVEAKNIGTIQAWRADLNDPAIRLASDALRPPEQDAMLRVRESHPSSAGRAADS